MSKQPLTDRVAELAGVAETIVIDLVAEDPDGRVLAVMVEDRPLGSDERQVERLKEKFTSHLQHITSE